MGTNTTYYPSFYFPLPSPRSFIYSLLTTIMGFPSFLSNLSFFLSVTTMSTPKPAAARGVQPQPAAVNGVQPQPAAVRGVQPQPAAVRGVQPQPAQQQFVVYSPSQQQLVVYSPSQASSSSWCTAPAGRAGGHAGDLGGEGEREERLRKVRSIPWLEYSSPCSSSQDTWQLNGKAVYNVPSREI